MKFVKLFEPMKINGFQIKNRIVMPAMHLNYSSDGSMSDVEIDFYEERARGGTGLIIVGGCGVEKRGGAPAMVMLDDDKYIPGFKKLGDVVHEYGAKIVAQLYHAGRYAFSFVSGEQPVSASAVYSKFSKETPKALSIEEIKEVQEKIADAAERVKKAGWEGVELLGSAGYLINQFLSPVTNKRTDEYGGSLENRLRFPLELIEIVKKRVSPNGEDFIVGMRVSGDDFIPDSNTYRENAEIAKRYADAGIDYINVTGGWHETRIPQITSQVPQGGYAYLAENIKKLVPKTPVFSGNRINDPVMAERIIRDFKADAVAMGRALIADPYLPEKTKNNKLWDIRKCVACNQGCFDHIFKMQPVECMRNYRVSREGRIDISEKVENPKKILIVGAGPAGLEAARVATILGHEVTVVEKKDKIGGQLNVAFVPHGRESMKEILIYYENQIKHHNIDVRLNTEATVDYINDFGADEVIFATGVKFSIPPIDGIDGNNGSDVVFADIALAGDHPVGKNVVVVGGAATGVETAIWAAKLGAFTSEQAHFLAFYDALPRKEIFQSWFRGPRNVTILELLPRIGTSIGKSTRWVMLDELDSLGINVLTNVKIQKFDKDKVVFEQNGETKEMKGIDTFILATGVKRNRDLYNKVKKIKPKFNIHRIGDCKKPRTIVEAIHDGFKTVYRLKK
ncbi:MAG: NAD(P)-binding protein [Candidatus Lokiarchaeota archaeon]|nr:NAD(P)-binding protein [Candidatus Lokiarchaeota archaeon]